MTPTEKLIKKHEHLVFTVLKQFGSRPEMVQGDLISEGLIALWKAIESYDESKAKFSNYALRCIKNSMIDHIRKEDRWAKDLAVIEDDELPADAVDIETGLANNEERYLMNIGIREAVGELNSREQYVLDNRLLSDTPMTFKAIAKVFHCDEKSVRRDEERIKSLIKENYNGERYDS